MIQTRSVRELWLPAATLVLAVGAWAVYVEISGISAVVLPSPKAVWESILQNSGSLWSATLYTTGETALGFVIAVPIGMGLAAAVAFSRVVERAIYPLLVASQSVPKLALAPIILVWLGYGMSSKVVVVVIVAFFPIVVDSALGIRTTPPALLEMSRLLGASRWQTYWKIQFKHSLPQTFSGLKIAITLAVVGAVIAEFIGSSNGLGFLVLSATAHSDMPLAFAALGYLAILRIILFLVIGAIDVSATRWVPRGSGGKARPLADKRTRGGPGATAGNASRPVPGENASKSAPGAIAPEVVGHRG